MMIKIQFISIWLVWEIFSEKGLDDIIVGGGRRSRVQMTIDAEGGSLKMAIFVMKKYVNTPYPPFSHNVSWNYWILKALCYHNIFYILFTSHMLDYIS